MRVKTLLRFSAVFFFLEGALLLVPAFVPGFMWPIFVLSMLGVAGGILILYGFSMVKGGHPTGWILVLIIGVLGLVTVQGIFLGPILAIYSAFKLRKWTRGMKEKDKLKLLDTVGEDVRIDELTREELGDLGPLIGAYAVSWEILDVKDFFFEDVDEDDDVIDLVDRTERLAHFPEYRMFEGLIEERGGEIEEKLFQPTW